MILINQSNKKKKLLVYTLFLWFLPIDLSFMWLEKITPYNDGIGTRVPTILCFCICDLPYHVYWLYITQYAIKIIVKKL